MHARLSAAGLAGLLLATSALAGTPTEGFYGTLAAGGDVVNDVTQSGTKLSFKVGPAFSAAIGYGDGSGLRTEISYIFAHNTVDGSGSSAGAHGFLQQHAGLVNVLYDFNDLSDSFTPHLGAGLGIDVERASALSSGYQTHFAYNLIAGAEVPLDDQVKIGLDYRYLSGVGESTKAITEDLGNNIFLLTLRYNFSTPAPAAAPPAPPPPPAYVPPAPPAKKPEAARQFQVFFDFDKSDLTAVATKVVHEAAEAVKAGNIAVVNVIGHTDTSGSAKYNQALSERRAESVKAELIADGVSAGVIATSGVGKTDLLVPTKDGVRDPQNRRAVIDLH